MKDLYLIPSAGLRVRDPETGTPLPSEGAYKPPSIYWIRRLRDGDVHEGKPPRATTSASKE